MNIENRVAEIERSLTAMSKDEYLREDLYPEMIRLEQQMVHTAYAEEHIENMKFGIMDVCNHLEEKCRWYNYPGGTLLKTFKKDCINVSMTLEALRAGNEGELRVFSCLNSMRTHITITNLELLSEGWREEIDALVFTDKALFLVEVKTPKHNMIVDTTGAYHRNGKSSLAKSYNVRTSFEHKEGILRNLMARNGIKKDLNIVRLLVCGNPDVSISVNYADCCYTNIQHLHSFFNNYFSSSIYSKEDQQHMAEIIMAYQDKGPFPTEYNFTFFKHVFAEIVAGIEAAANPVTEFENTVVPKEIPAPEVSAIDGTKNKVRFEWLKEHTMTILTTVCIIVSFLSSFELGKKYGSIRQ